MNTSIRIAVAIMAAVAFVNPVYGQKKAPGRATDAAVLAEVVRSLRGGMTTAKAVHVVERRFSGQLDATGRLSATAGLAFEGRHTGDVLDSLRAVTGFPMVSSLEEAPRNCVPDLKMPPPAEVCRLRDADVILTVGVPTFTGDTAIVLAYSVQNSTRAGLGVVSRLLEVKAVRIGKAWRVVALRPVGPFT